jgi:hypothetical protein
MHISRTPTNLFLVILACFVISLLISLMLVGRDDPAFFTLVGFVQVVVLMITIALCWLKIL